LLGALTVFDDRKQSMIDWIYSLQINAMDGDAVYVLICMCVCLDGFSAQMLFVMLIIMLLFGDTARRTVDDRLNLLAPDQCQGWRCSECAHLSVRLHTCVPAEG
jgi:hypothetical protein